MNAQSEALPGPANTWLWNIRGKKLDRQRRVPVEHITLTPPWELAGGPRGGHLMQGRAAHCCCNQHCKPRGNLAGERTGCSGILVPGCGTAPAEVSHRLLYSRWIKHGWWRVSSSPFCWLQTAFFSRIQGVFPCNKALRSCQAATAEHNQVQTVPSIYEGRMFVLQDRRDVLDWFSLPP